MIEWIVAGAGVLGAAGFSARWNWWRPKAEGLPVLMYHKVGIAPAGSRIKSLWVSPEKFSRQMDYLKKHGYTFITFSDLARQAEGTPLPDKPVLVTFDDGYKNNYTEAYRILKEKGAKGNIFLVYNTIGKNNLWHDPASEAWIPMLSWEEILEMVNSGVMDMGSHTMNHANLNTLAEKDPEKISWELRESKARLEDRLGRKIPCFAYPYGAGAYNPEVRKRVMEAGYLFDFAIRQGTWRFADWNREAEPIKRLFIRGDDTMLDFHLQITRGKSRF